MEAGPAAEFVRELLTKFPHAGNLTVAKMAVKEKPELFTGIEQARGVVRYHRGAYGAHNRRHADTIERLTLPRGKKRIGGWEPYQVTGPALVLVMSDMHVPYHETEAIQLAIDHGKKAGATHIHRIARGKIY